MQEKRLARLEAGLEGREKVLAWLHVNQQVSANVASRSCTTKKEIDLELLYKGADAVELPEKFSIWGNVNGLGIDVRYCDRACGNGQRGRTHRH